MRNSKSIGQLILETSYRQTSRNEILPVPRLMGFAKAQNMRGISWSMFFVTLGYLDSFLYLPRNPVLAHYRAMAQCSGYGGYREITRSSNVERRYYLDGSPLSNPVISSSSPALPLKVVWKSPLNR
ncbi:hypothetical protein J6590_096311 [Homalodisca vitripennis]|nr:hypothetical protein J6590_099564 [Homalodisca vitripennis]KAG8334177.1 hypothetical protein J6590_096311 [Homalodisca vitripennis]